MTLGTSSKTNNTVETESPKNIYLNNLYKSGKKETSLFGNNPEIPRIGQRFVKPIEENVFAGCNFSDLDIHRFSVRNLCSFIKIY